MPTDRTWLDSLEIHHVSEHLPLGSFACNEKIDWFLREEACSRHRNRITNVACSCAGETIVGYVGTAMSEVNFKEAVELERPQELSNLRHAPNGRVQNTFPAMLIGMLGVHRDFKRRGLGGEMVRTVVDDALRFSESLGCRFVSVQADRTEEALALYKANRFEVAFDDADRSRVWMLLDLGAR